MLDLLIKAGRVAIPKHPETDRRNFLHGCIGIRNDGVEVSSPNGAVISSSIENYRIVSDAHAEARCLKKMGRGGILYVSRVLKGTGEIAMSYPCKGCRLQIKAAEIARVYFSIDPYHYGIWNPKTDYAKIYSV